MHLHKFADPEYGQPLTRRNFVNRSRDKNSVGIRAGDRAAVHARALNRNCAEETVGLRQS